MLTGSFPTVRSKFALSKNELDQHQTNRDESSTQPVYSTIFFTGWQVRINDE